MQAGRIKIRDISLSAKGTDVKDYVIKTVFLSKPQPG
jgi:hypothetical protein